MELPLQKTCLGYIERKRKKKKKKVTVAGGPRKMERLIFTAGKRASKGKGGKLGSWVTKKT